MSSWLFTHLKNDQLQINMVIKESTMVGCTACLNLKKLQQAFIMVLKEFHKSVEADIIDVQQGKEIHKPRQVWFKVE